MMVDKGLWYRSEDALKVHQLAAGLFMIDFMLILELHGRPEHAKVT